jgi:hypothetical protein
VVSRELWARRRKQKGAAVDWETILKPKPSPSDDATRRQREEARAQYMRQLAEQAKQREAERIAQRELSMRMIDVGYKALAKELHPDKGGSSEAMSRLNRARRHQKQMA